MTKLQIQYKIISTYKNDINKKEGVLSNKTKYAFRGNKFIIIKDSLNIKNKPESITNWCNIRIVCTWLPNCLLDYNTEKARNILNIIIEFINKYDQFVYAPYDASIGIVIMLLRLLKAFDRFKDIQNIIEAQTYVTRAIYILDQKYPTASDSFEDALAIEFEKDKPPYETTAFWGYYVLLICALDQSKIYDELKDFLNTDLENTTKRVWFLRKAEEEFFIHHMQ